ncbi:MAG: LamG-like jellyroll fold domain-containing protein [Minisyncoccales bacterium]|jgi:prepilin-type N-terminal cleavage/methylation domain-containing protein
MYKQKSFTLIELLVVIVIIGILAGVIMISTSSSIDKASIAKSKVFADEIRNNLMIDIVSEWNFDNALNPYQDSVGINHGTCTNCPLYKTKDSKECIKSGCLNFKSENYVDLKNDSSLKIKDEITISLWLKGSGTALVKGGEPETYSVGIRNLKPFFYRECQDGENKYLNGNTIIDINKWNHFLFVDDGNLLKIYINTQLDPVTLSSIGWSAGLDNSSLYIGKGDVSGSESSLAGFLNGLIDEIQVYNSILSSVLNKKNYIAGLNFLLLQGNISKEEYNERINALAYDN